MYHLRAHAHTRLPSPCGQRISSRCTMLDKGSWLYKLVRYELGFSELASSLTRENLLLTSPNHFFPGQYPPTLSTDSFRNSTSIRVERSISGHYSQHVLVRRQVLVHGHPGDFSFGLHYSEPGWCFTMPPLDTVGELSYWCPPPGNNRPATFRAIQVNRTLSVHIWHRSKFAFSRTTLGSGNHLMRHWCRAITSFILQLCLPAHGSALHGVMQWYP